MLFNMLLLTMIGSGILGTILLITKNKIINLFSMVPILTMIIIYSSLTYSVDRVKIAPKNTNKYKVVEQKDIVNIDKDNEYYTLTDENNMQCDIKLNEVTIISDNKKNRYLEKRIYEWKYEPGNLFEKIKLSEMQYYGLIENDTITKQRYVLIK
ncbi:MULTISPECIES: hypothetical protein [Clostridium]|uniref:Uncharacterized protein n=2 Tax=Clostridium TaxID=1485 RepID=A0A1L3NI09_CLOSG|nr:MULTISPECIES: hypothetical protein [Clostridium]AJE13368.1 hypothetical protein T259_3985 [Clostridium botulinum CDC_1436]APH15767.1 hypothetical protein NPD5_3937 [Clostridium sporogenes]MBD5639450.1 hypothetical protein [Clostridium botulinum]MDI6919004.1 hypothetical protein [Clostridium botulinum]WMU99778.1 hypothetical protein QA656_19285 [Clostridium botulinum]